MRARSRAAIAARAVGFLLPFAVLALLLTATSASSATAPVLDTTITAGPAEGEIVHVEDVRFSFAATLAGASFPAATFRCSLDGGAFEGCQSPNTLEELDDGPHTFAVAAQDPTGLAADPDPARRSFTVEADESECEESEDEEEAEEGEDEEEECESAEERGRNSKNPSASGPPPDSCLLRTARARLFTYGNRDRVRLVIRYTTSSPAEVHVELRLGSGANGARLAGASHHFAAKGLFRLTQSLSPHEADRVRAANGFTVTLGIPAAPHFCERYETRHLTVRRPVHDNVIWFQSDSAFGTTSRGGSRH